MPSLTSSLMSKPPPLAPSLPTDDIAHLSGELDFASKLLEATAQEYPLRLVPGSRTAINLRWNLGADEVFSAAVGRKHSNSRSYPRAHADAAPHQCSTTYLSSICPSCQCRSLGASGGGLCSTWQAVTRTSNRSSAPLE